MNQEQYQNGDSNYLTELFMEKEAMSSYPGFVHSPNLIAHEIDRLQSSSKKMIDLHVCKPMKAEAKVRLPVKEFPMFNFVGKIIGPKAQTLKLLQEETGCKLIIQGSGSMRDKAKEEELKKEGGKYSHLHEELHLLIEAYGHPADCYRKLSLALWRLHEFFIQENIGEVGKLAAYRQRGGGAMASRQHGNTSMTSTWSSSSGGGRGTTATTGKASGYPGHSSHYMASATMPSSAFNHNKKEESSGYGRYGP